MTVTVTAPDAVVRIVNDRSPAGVILTTSGTAILELDGVEALRAKVAGQEDWESFYGSCREAIARATRVSAVPGEVPAEGA